MGFGLGIVLPPDTGPDAHTSGLSRSGYFSEVFHERAIKSGNIGSSMGQPDSRPVVFADAK
jgi:hypothetical protein